jgi:hypothetical protein
LKITSYSIEDLHQIALNEFDSHDPAVLRLNAAYVEAQIRYIAELSIIRAERAAEDFQE